MSSQASHLLQQRHIPTVYKVLNFSLTRPQEKDRAGSERHPKPCNPCTSARSRRFSLSLTPRLERCCCRKVAMRRAAPSRLSPPVPTPECRTTSSDSCCSADSAYLSRSPRNAALAGDSWTCTATTGQPAHRWECWRGELAPWSGQRLASARRPVPASHRMSPSATSTSMCPRATDAV